MVFKARYDLFFGMLRSVLPILFIDFSEGRIFKKKLPFTSKIQYFKVVSRLLAHPKKNQPRYNYGFLSIIRSDRPEVFLQVTFLLKMDFESITYIKSVVLYQLSYPMRNRSRIRTCASFCCSNLTELQSYSGLMGFEPMTHRVVTVFWLTIKTFKSSCI